MAQTRYQKKKLKNLTDQQHIIAGGTFSAWLECMPEGKPLSLHGWAGELNAWCFKNGRFMPEETYFGFGVLRLVEEGLVEMTNNGPCKEDCCDDFDNVTQVDLLVNFKKLHPDAQRPKYAKPGDAGADVYSVEDVEIRPGETKLVSLGIAIEVPDGWEMQVRSRSGLASKGILVANSPGTIDSGYRGECKVILTYVGKEPYFKINKGDRIAQFVLKQAPTAYFDEVSELSSTERGVGGFGSTGVK